MMLLLTTLAPVLAYLLFLKLLDSFAIVRWKLLLLMALAGVAICGISFLISYREDLLPLPYYAPVLEEALKGAVVVYLIARKRIVFMSEALCYGGAVGGGFAFLENIIFVTMVPDMGVASALYRGLGTALMHTGCTALVATQLVAMKEQNGIGKCAPLKIVAAFALPLLIHAVFNMFLLPVLVQLFITIIIFLGLFQAVSSYNEKKIFQWMDSSLTDHADLLLSMKKGELTDTPSGRYILSIKEQFDPEVLFDMLCYIQLYLELIIEAKSRMLLADVGMDDPSTPEQITERKAKVDELVTLRKNIGRTGERALRPIVELSDADLKVLGING